MDAVCQVSALAEKVALPFAFYLVVLRVCVGSLVSVCVVCTCVCVYIWVCFVCLSACVFVRGVFPLCLTTLRYA